MNDKRLIGEWISDRRKTVGEWVFPKRITKYKKSKFRKIFGKLIVKYTKSFIYTNYDEYKTKQKYIVIGKDLDSVAILIINEITKEEEIKHIKFKDNHYYINLGRNREWFRKLQIPK